MAVLQKEKSGRGFFPAAAAAPTYPSFRDIQLKKQCHEISKTFSLKALENFYSTRASF
jgi:hypothetical protein